MLNEKNEVITAMFPTNQDVDKCNAHLKKVEKIFKSESLATLCVRGELKNANGDYTDLHDFGQLGKHVDVYEPMTFDTICNSKQCHSISETWTHTCTGLN